MEKKRCNSCKEEKPLKAFYKINSNFPNLRAECKCCSRSKGKINYLKTKEHKKQYAKNNAEKISKTKRLYYNKNKEFFIAQAYKREKTRLNTDINFKISKYLRSRMYNAVKKGYKSGSAVNDLGCSIDDLKNYMKKLFTKGMSWENYGDWHIDHKIPLIKFDLTNPEQFKKAVHYSNLQPLWAIDNLKKGGKYVD